MQRNAQHKKIRAIDLFCGAGGSSWGARAAGLEIVAGFDLWPLAGKAHVSNFPASRFYGGRLEEYDVQGLTSDLKNIDLILASPECTNHSPAKGNKPRCEQSKESAFQVTRFAEKLKPRWLIIENVVSMRRWKRYTEFTNKLQALGYSLHEQVLDATDFGVGQSRRRLFLLCDREQSHSAILPTCHEAPFAASCIDLDGDYRWSALYTKKRAQATLERAERAMENVGKKAPFIIVYYGSDGAGGWQALDRPLRTITTVDRFAIVKPSRNGPLMRMLQVPELQKAMGMDDMIFEHGTRRDKIKMLGNAVCPPVMKEAVRHLLNSKY